MTDSSYSYYDYAWDDHQFILQAFKDNYVRNSMCAIAQNTCERYLKYLIDTYYQPNSEDDLSKKMFILRTHNLIILMNYWEKVASIKFPTDVVNALNAVNGYYFTTRYPGADSFFVDTEQIKIAIESTNICKEFVDSEIKRLSSETFDSKHQYFVANNITDPEEQLAELNRLKTLYPNLDDKSVLDQAYKDLCPNNS